MLAHFDNNKVSFDQQRLHRATHHRATTSSCKHRQNIVPAPLRRRENTKLASKLPAVVKVEEPAPVLMTPTRGVTLPTSLSRPKFEEIQPQAIYACDPRLEGANLCYVRDQLVYLGAPMITGIRSAQIMNFSRTQLPKELEVVFTDSVSLPVVAPTHILAVRSMSPPKNGRTQVKLFPIHELVFAANCSTFPRLPKSATATAAGNTSQTASLPVVQITVPSISTFEVFQAHLYLKDATALRVALLPSGWSRDERSILRTIDTVYGLWLNACAFGVCDEPLFQTLDACWGEALHALEVATS